MPQLYTSPAGRLGTFEECIGTLVGSFLPDRDVDSRFIPINILPLYFARLTRGFHVRVNSIDNRVNARLRVTEFYGFPYKLRPKPKIASDKAVSVVHL